MSAIDREALIAEYDRIHVGPPGKARQLMVNAQTIEPEPQKKKTVFVECDRILTRAEYLDMLEEAKRQATDDVNIVLLHAGMHVVQPDRPKGKWMPVINGRGGHECNQCHEYAPSWATGEERLTKFCPNCGADMREEQK